MGPGCDRNRQVSELSLSTANVRPMDDSPRHTPDAPPLVEHTVEEDESVNTAIVEAIAAVSDSPVTDVPPLYEVIDPDALESLFTTRQAGAFLAIRFNGYLVYVRANGRVRLYQEDRKVTSV